MRCTQDMGYGKHNPIDEEELKYLEWEKYDTAGMFEDRPLFQGCFNGIPIYREIVQYEVWSSGPMLYMAYQRIADNELLSYWTKEEVDEHSP
jgi:hypothetical protein